MIDVKFLQLEGTTGNVIEMGNWLDEHMPNPPLPEPQRWTVGHDIHGHPGIRFADEKDATWFMVRWS